MGGFGGVELWDEVVAAFLDVLEHLLVDHVERVVVVAIRHVVLGLGVQVELLLLPSIRQLPLHPLRLFLRFLHNLSLSLSRRHLTFPILHHNPAPQLRYILLYCVPERIPLRQNTNRLMIQPLPRQQNRMVGIGHVSFRQMGHQ